MLCSQNEINYYWFIEFFTNLIVASFVHVPLYLMHFPLFPPFYCPLSSFYSPNTHLFPLPVFFLLPLLHVFLSQETAANWYHILSLVCFLHLLFPLSFSPHFNLYTSYSFFWLIILSTGDPRSCDPSMSSLPLETFSLHFVLFILPAHLYINPVMFYFRCFVCLLLLSIPCPPLCPYCPNHGYIHKAVFNFGGLVETINEADVAHSLTVLIAMLLLRSYHSIGRH